MRMIPEYALNAEDIQQMMLDIMDTHLSLKTKGYRCSTGQTFNLLLKAVADSSSLDTCKTRAKDGTTHFFRIASAYVIWREVRLTPVQIYFKKGDQPTDKNVILLS
jgi:hypothetical protein